MRLTRTVMVLGLFVAMILAPMVLAPMVLASQARAEPAVSDFRLDNGMEVVVIEDHRAPVVTHMVWYRVGAADEPWGHSGIAHFFEHLMFKATGKIADGAFCREWRIGQRFHLVRLHCLFPAYRRRPAGAGYGHGSGPDAQSGAK
jgi:hypothetical protein